MSLFSWLRGPCSLIFCLPFIGLIIFSGIILFDSVAVQFSNIKTMICIIGSVHIALLSNNVLLSFAHMVGFWKDMKECTKFIFKTMKMLTVAGVIYSAAILTHILGNDYFYSAKSSQNVYT